LQEGLQTAEDLAREARSMIATYGGRQTDARWWQPWGPKRLTAGEKKLKQFLSRTLLPCLEILIGGALLYLRRFQEAEAHVAPLRDRAAENDLSFRVYYNLACYEAGRGAKQEGDQSSLLALQYLGKALRLVSGRRRDELVRWAQKDPSLKPLREERRFRSPFREILSRYEPSSPAS
jgi:hypothetical protein